MRSQRCFSKIIMIIVIITQMVGRGLGEDVGLCGGGGGMEKWGGGTGTFQIVFNLRACISSA